MAEVTLVGKQLQRTYMGTWASLWKVTAEQEGGKLTIECISSPMSYKNGNWQVGDTATIDKRDFKEHKK